MCGIAGLLLHQPHPEIGRWSAMMTQSMFHRGPDDGGVTLFEIVARHQTTQSEINDNNTVHLPLGNSGHVPLMTQLPRHQVAIGARRLAIFDLSSAGRQPMSDHHRRGWIVFNGAIYNHPELRRELESLGRSFGSNTDTEVVLHAFQQWNTAAFARFNGMFSIAIYEPQSHRLTLARDRFGIKPLYYIDDSRGTAFASEIKALITLPWVNAAPNHPRIADFLADGRCDHTDDTMFAHIRKIPPGCYATLTHARERWQMSVSPYPMSYAGDTASQSFDDAATSTRRRLRDACALHLRSDVPIGSCLSGGLDSSAIVATIDMLAVEDSRAPHWRQHAIHATLPGDVLDERRFADALLSSRPRLHGEFVEPRPDTLIDDMSRMLHHQEEPFGSPSIFMQWEVMKRAQLLGLRVLIDGQGGDELFCGYPGYLPALAGACLRQLRLITARQLSTTPDARHHFPHAFWKHALAQAISPARRRALQCDRSRHIGWLSPDLAAQLEPLTPAPLPHRAQDMWPANFRSYWHEVLTATSLPSLLRFEDRNSMAFSIEARVPMLEHDLFDSVAATPPEILLRGGRLKALLRAAVRDTVPQVIVDRVDKIGFAAPTTRWMNETLRPWWQELVMSRSLRQRGWIQADRLPQWSGKNLHQESLTLWRVAIVEAWSRQWLDAPKTPMQ